MISLCNTKSQLSLDREDIIKIIKYAFAHCEYKCPAERDPETCIILAELSKMLGLKLPCYDEFGEFTENTFRSIIKEIENRRGKSIEEVIRELREKGPTCLQDQIDEIDATFALEVIKAFNKRRSDKVKLV